MGAVIDDNVILQRIYLFCVTKSSQQTNKQTCSKNKSFEIQIDDILQSAADLNKFFFHR
jgi:hypothetical protein